MKRYLYSLLCFGICWLLLASCEQPTSSGSLVREPQEWLLANGQPLGYYQYEQFEKLLEGNNDTTYIVNFWATWCPPCVKELPYFQKVYQKYKNQKVHLILVSLDFKDKLEHELYPFLKEHPLKGELVLLNQEEQENWMAKVNMDWDGALPATLIYRKSKKQFYPQSFEYDELELKLKRFLSINS